MKQEEVSKIQDEVNLKDEETRRLQEEVEDARRRQEEATAALMAATTTPQHHHVADNEHEENDDVMNGEVGQWQSERNLHSSLSFDGFNPFCYLLTINVCLLVHVVKACGEGYLCQR